MRSVLLAFSLWISTVSSAVAADRVPVKGAGATTATALVAAWSKAYVGQGGSGVDYEAVGSVKP